jgi:hypothetical protein
MTQVISFYTADDKLLTPARAELARLNAELAAAVAEQETVATPLRRLENVVFFSKPISHTRIFDALR